MSSISIYWHEETDMYFMLNEHLYIYSDNQEKWVYIVEQFKVPDAKLMYSWYPNNVLLLEPDKIYSINEEELFDSLYVPTVDEYLRSADFGKLPISEKDVFLDAIPL